MIKDALWTALRALEERIDLQRRVSRRLRERDGRRAENYECQALESQPHVKVLREVLLDRGGPEG